MSSPQTQSAFYTAEATRALESFAAAEGFASATLVERAAAGAFANLRWRWPCTRRTVVCRSGNNSGDGYALARVAHAAGFTVSGCGTPNSQPAKRAHAALVAAGLTPHALPAAIAVLRVTT